MSGVFEAYAAYLFLPDVELMLDGAGMRGLAAERWFSGQLDLTSWQGVIAAGKLPLTAGKP